MKTHSGTAPRRVSTLALVAIMGAAALLTTACGEEAPDTVAVGADGGAQASPADPEPAAGGGEGGDQAPGEPAAGGGEGGDQAPGEPAAGGGEGGDQAPGEPAAGGGEGGGQDTTLQEFCSQLAYSDLSDVESLQSLREVAPDDLVDDLEVMIEQTPLLEQDPLNADLDALTEATLVVTDYNMESCFTVE